MQISFDCMTGPVISEFVLHGEISHFQYLTRIVYVHTYMSPESALDCGFYSNPLWSGIEAINTWQGWWLFVYYVLGWMEYLKSTCLEYCICTSLLISKHYAMTTGRLLKAVMLDREIGLDHGISNYYLTRKYGWGITHLHLILDYETIHQYLTGMSLLTLSCLISSLVSGFFWATATPTTNTINNNLVILKATTISIYQQQRWRHHTTTY